MDSPLQEVAIMSAVAITSVVFLHYRTPSKGLTSLLLIFIVLSSFYLLSFLGNQLFKFTSDAPIIINDSNERVYSQVILNQLKPELEEWKTQMTKELIAQLKEIHTVKDEQTTTLIEKIKTSFESQLIAHSSSMKKWIEEATGTPALENVSDKTQQIPNDSSEKQADRDFNKGGIFLAFLNFLLSLYLLRRIGQVQLDNQASEDVSEDIKNIVNDSFRQIFHEKFKEILDDKLSNIIQVATSKNNDNYSKILEEKILRINETITVLFKNLPNYLSQYKQTPSTPTSDFNIDSSG